MATKSSETMFSNPTNGYMVSILNLFYCRCGHCQTMGPVFEQLAPKYPMAVFLKVNVDDCTVSDTVLLYFVFEIVGVDLQGGSPCTWPQ